MSTGRLYLHCLSLVCAVGLNPRSSSAALRAGISGLVDLPYADNQGEPVIGAQVPGIEPGLTGRSRLTALLTRGCDDIRSRLPGHLDIGEMPLLLCTRGADQPGAKLRGIVDGAQAALQITFQRAHSAHFPSGAVAVFEALAHARKLFQDRSTQACLIAAVDSFIDARTLQWLDQGKRLRTPQQSDGVAPGEAAGVLLVCAEPEVSGSLAVCGLGFGHETATIHNDEPFLGNGMTTAVRNALAEASVPIHNIDFRLSDVAGESYGFEELVLTQARLTRVPRQTQDLWHPAAFVGDCGAAAGLIQLAWAEQAFSRGYAPGPLALAHGSAASGPRAAAVLEGEIAHVA
jgi:3-oxoacyl-[acyl-carrier-protein] synthase I